MLRRTESVAAPRDNPDRKPAYQVERSARLTYQHGNNIGIAGNGTLDHIREDLATRSSKVQSPSLAIGAENSGRGET